MKLTELRGRWDTLKLKASQRKQDLEDSLQAQQYFADANEAESWMREKEPIVGSTDYGKDEDSAEVKVFPNHLPARAAFVSASTLFVTNAASPSFSSTGAS